MTPSPLLTLKASSVQGVPNGTPVAASVAQLETLLGKPSAVFDGGCDINGSHTKTLSWGNISVTFSDDGAHHGQRLVSWDVAQTGDKLFRLALPYGLEIGAAETEVLSKTGGSPSSGPGTSGDLELVEAPDGVMYAIATRTRKVVNISAVVTGSASRRPAARRAAAMRSPLPDAAHTAGRCRHGRTGPGAGEPVRAGGPPPATGDGRRSA
jgi:hypothetical protein